ncbi:hypothetical protein TIFTF001_024204 [Ficus carica]|uniref:BCNT-C domain-containing protein n=1 Tax=Ficus carica TaxID=3494 RepID=A0AA88AXW3_FICCA|nr:hypothetical protein TIFTF001_024204 [Ficus carica]
MEEAEGVVKHVLLAKFKEGVSEDQIEKLIKDYANLINLIEPMKAFHWGTDVSIENLHQGFTHIFESTFESTEGVADFFFDFERAPLIALLASSMATASGLDASGSFSGVEGKSKEPVKADPTSSSSEAKTEQSAAKARVDAVWEQMNKGISNKALNDLLKKPSLGTKDTVSPSKEAPKKEPSPVPSTSSDEAKRLAAAALSAVKEAAASASGRGKVEITEVRDFAGQDIEVKKLVDADSKEALEKTKVAAPSAVDAVLEQIKKKQKLSVLDKTKKDWGEYKGENKGLEEELDAYKKSSNQYLEKVSFLQRTDYREFERERDARLAIQAKRRPDMREDP